MTVRRASLAACLAVLLGATPAWAESELPHSRATIERILVATGGAVLDAQRKLFPEHYREIVDLLLEHERAEPSEEARLAGLTLMHGHWEHYNALVRRGFALEWRALLLRRRELFALLESHGDPRLCRDYEYHGISALTTSGREEYRQAAEAYLAAFLEAAAAARDAPQEHRPETQQDFEPLVHAMAEAGLDPQPLSARLTAGQVDPGFCRAMIQVLDQVLDQPEETAALLWRFLVTAPTEGEQ